MCDSCWHFLLLSQRLECFLDKTQYLCNAVPNDKILDVQIKKKNSQQNKNVAQ